jgi:hypothetical protein
MVVIATIYKLHFRGKFPGGKRNIRTRPTESLRPNQSPLQCVTWSFPGKAAGVWRSQTTHIKLRG